MLFRSIWQLPGYRDWETERDVYELLDNEAVSFDEPTGATDEVVDVFFIGDVDEEKEHNAKLVQ